MVVGRAHEHMLMGRAHEHMLVGRAHELKVFGRMTEYPFPSSGLTRMMGLISWVRNPGLCPGMSFASK